MANPRRTRHWLVLGVVLVKVLIIAGIVLLPSGLAVSLGAAHGIVLVVMLGSVAVALIAYRLRGKTPPARLSHRPSHWHRREDR